MPPTVDDGAAEPEPARVAMERLTAEEEALRARAAALRADAQRLERARRLVRLREYEEALRARADELHAATQAQVGARRRGGSWLWEWPCESA